jgi:hypothetical protein
VQHSVFSDMSLTKEEHLQVVNKLGKYLEKMTPQEIPPFIYQLLRLCKHNNSRIIFLKLQQYFGLRYNENLANETDSNSDSTQFDIIGSHFCFLSKTPLFGFYCRGIIKFFLKIYFYHFSFKSYVLCLMFCLSDILW